MLFSVVHTVELSSLRTPLWRGHLLGYRFFGSNLTPEIMVLSQSSIRGPTVFFQIWVHALLLPLGRTYYSSICSKFCGSFWMHRETNGLEVVCNSHATVYTNIVLESFHLVSCTLLLTETPPINSNSIYIIIFQHRDSKYWDSYY